MAPSQHTWTLERGPPSAMAELVNKILESVLPELEELERVGIFNEAEIR